MIGFKIQEDMNCKSSEKYNEPQDCVVWFNGKLTTGIAGTSQSKWTTAKSESDLTGQTRDSRWRNASACRQGWPQALLIDFNVQLQTTNPASQFTKTSTISHG
jgi:hypothetical protein